MLAQYSGLGDAELEDILRAALGDIPNAAPGRNPSLARAGQERLDSLTKPKGSLGRLEGIALALYCLADGRPPLAVEPGILFTVAADHGVTAEGVSSAAQEVTGQMLRNFLSGGAGVNALCFSAGLDFLAVDAGVKGPDLAPHERLVSAKIAQGTGNIALGPAMTRREALLALVLGLNLAAGAAARGYKCLAAGEMGIGNTTPSSALYSAWLGLPPEDTVGQGAGLSEAGLARKKEVVARALAANRAAVDSGDPIAVLAALGGLEIGAMAGLMLGAARARLPFLVDGFIATAAFVAAWKLCPKALDCCFFAHASAERAHSMLLKLLGQKPLLDLGLRLGEGTGAALAYPILRAAASMFNNMASFGSAEVTPNH